MTRPSVSDAMAPGDAPSRPPPSLRQRLLAGVLGVLVAFTGIDLYWQYQTLHDTVQRAYDRMLAAAVYSVGDSLHTDGGRLRGSLPLALQEAFEAAGGSRVHYRVTDLRGDTIAGDEFLPVYRPQPGPDRPTAPHMQTTEVQGTRLRLAVMYQPIEMSDGQQVAVIQVAHTLEARDQALRDALLGAGLRQVVQWLLVSGLLMWLILQQLRPLQTLSREINARHGSDLSPLQTPVQQELQPLQSALNQLMARLAGLLRQQERFVADASHQLQTPLTVLKTQLQAAIAGQPHPPEPLQDMLRTTDRAAGLARQMLSLARVHQASAQAEHSLCDLPSVIEEACLEASPLMGRKRLDFSLELSPVSLQADAWMLGELVRNLLHNAIRHTPPRQALGIQLEIQGLEVLLTVWDTGPGVDPAVRERLFQPFCAVPGPQQGSGLGLAICHDIVLALGGRIGLDAREGGGTCARVHLPRQGARPWAVG